MITVSKKKSRSTNLCRVEDGLSKVHPRRGARTGRLSDLRIRRAPVIAVGLDL